MLARRVIETSDQAHGDNLPKSMIDAHRTAPRAASWSFVTDGPPLWLVAVIFAGLLAYWLAPGAPAPLAGCWAPRCS